MTNLKQLIERRQGEVTQKILDLLNAYTEVNVDNNCVYSNIDYNNARAPLIIALEKQDLQTATQAYLAGLKAALEGLPERKNENTCNDTPFTEFNNETHYNNGFNWSRQVIKSHIEALIAEVEGTSTTPNQITL